MTALLEDNLIPNRLFETDRTFDINGFTSTCCFGNAINIFRIRDWKRTFFFYISTIHFMSRPILLLTFTGTIIITPTFGTTMSRSLLSTTRSVTRYRRTGEASDPFFDLILSLPCITRFVYHCDKYLFSI